MTIRLTHVRDRWHVKSPPRGMAQFHTEGTDRQIQTHCFREEHTPTHRMKDVNAVIEREKLEIYMVTPITYRGLCYATYTHTPHLNLSEETHTQSQDYRGVNSKC